MNLKVCDFIICPLWVDLIRETKEAGPHTGHIDLTVLWRDVGAVRYLLNVWNTFLRSVHNGISKVCKTSIAGFWVMFPSDEIVNLFYGGKLLNVCPIVALNSHVIDNIVRDAVTLRSEHTCLWWEDWAPVSCSKRSHGFYPNTSRENIGLSDPVGNMSWSYLFQWGFLNTYLYTVWCVMLACLDSIYSINMSIN